MSAAVSSALGWPYRSHTALQSRGREAGRRLRVVRPFREFWSHFVARWRNCYSSVTFSQTVHFHCCMPSCCMPGVEWSYPELKPEYSFAPKWWRVTAYVIAGCTVAFFSFSLFGVFLMLFGN
jgi:hypothetical protein